MLKKRQSGGKWRVLLYDREADDLLAWEFLAIKKLLRVGSDDDIELLSGITCYAAQHHEKCIELLPDLVLVVFNGPPSIKIPVNAIAHIEEAVGAGWVHVVLYRDGAFEQLVACEMQNNEWRTVRRPYTPDMAQGGEASLTAGATHQPDNSDWREDSRFASPT